MTNIKYTINEINTLTGKSEDIEVTEEVFCYYRRSNWIVTKNDKKHAYNSIPFSALKGAEDGELSTFSEFVSETFNPEVVVAQKEELILAMKILNRCLTPVQCQRYMQHYYEGLSTRQIADIEGVNQRSVMDSLEMAQKKINKFLK